MLTATYEGGRTDDPPPHDEGRRKTVMMTRTIFSKVVWVGRATTFMVGLAVIVALTAGLASTALAGTGVGARLDLGKTNTVNAVTKLVGSVVGPSLQIDNNSAGASATALDLQVEPGKAPMSVNSDGRVANLNADKIDGQDSGAFMPASTYRVDRPIAVDTLFSTAVSCDPGDLALSGAWSGKANGTEITNNAAPRITDSESVSFLITNTSELIDDMALHALCADLPPLR